MKFFSLILLLYVTAGLLIIGLGNLVNSFISSLKISRSFNKLSMKYLYIILIGFFLSATILDIITNYKMLYFLEMFKV